MGVPLARRNLLHEKGKLLLSVLGVGAALTLIVLLLGFREGLYSTLSAYVDNMDAHLIVAQTGVKGFFASNSAIPAAIHDDIDAASGAVETGHILVADIIFTVGATKTPVLLIGYNPDTGMGGPWSLGQGRGVQDDDEVALDLWLAQRNGIAVGDRLELLGRPFTVVGLTRETASWMSPYIFISQQAAEDALQMPGGASFYFVQLAEGADIDAAARAVEAQVPGVDALRPSEVAVADREVLAAVMETPIVVMLAISAIIGVAVMGLTAYTAVADRRRDYGVLKAIGAGRGRLNRLVAVETICRAALGFVLGAGLSYLSAWLIMTLWPQFTIVIRPESVALAGAAALGMTVVAALLPIRRVAAIDPALVFKA
ncbi:MAG: ABC transporter permease [Anaerolineae bacterium]|nr:ABC transporter permease [Anaerolineae bacterium]